MDLFMELILPILFSGIMLIPLGFFIYNMLKDVRTKQSKKKKYDIQDEMNMFDEAKWVEKVIKSCKTYKQLIVARKLYSTLSDKYENKVDHDLLHKIDNNLYWDWYRMTDQVTYD